VLSAATLQLLGGFFAYQALGTRPVKGIAQPLEVYQVLYESTARSRLEVAGSTSLTPLLGREQEVGLLRERWAQVKDGLGQVALLSGEAGIGKSRLVQVLKEQVATEPQAWLTLMRLPLSKRKTRGQTRITNQPCALLAETAPTTGCQVARYSTCSEPS
jgi:hypothetical protein